MPAVLLGLPGNWASDHREPSDHYTSKIGGLPDWPSVRPRSELLDCFSCGNRLSLVSQVYAPFESPKIEERTIYIFGCLTPTCGTNPGSWRALRVQKQDSAAKSDITFEDESNIVAPCASNSKAITQDDLDSENSDDIDLESLSKALFEAATIASSKKKERKGGGSDGKSKSSPLLSETRLLDDNRPAIPCFYLYTQEETSSKKVLPLHLNYKLPNEEVQEEVWGEENYEYDRAPCADRTYLKFIKRLDACAEQCFRYCYGGEPLLATKDVLQPPEKCGRCGAARHFEIQLMPPLIYFLEEAAEEDQKLSLNNWNWLTLIVYTCSESCCDAGDEAGEVMAGSWIVAEEAVSVQYEEAINSDQFS